MDFHLWIEFFRCFLRRRLQDRFSYLCFLDLIVCVFEPVINFGVEDRQVLEWLGNALLVVVMRRRSLPLRVVSQGSRLFLLRRSAQSRRKKVLRVSLLCVVCLRFFDLWLCQKPWIFFARVEHGVTDSQRLTCSSVVRWHLRFSHSLGQQINLCQKTLVLALVLLLRCVSHQVSHCAHRLFWQLYNHLFFLEQRAWLSHHRVNLNLFCWLSRLFLFEIEVVLWQNLRLLQFIEGILLLGFKLFSFVALLLRELVKLLLLWVIFFRHDCVGASRVIHRLSKFVLHARVLGLRVPIVLESATVMLIQNYVILAI